MRLCPFFVLYCALAGVVSAVAQAPAVPVPAPLPNAAPVPALPQTAPPVEAAPGLPPPAVSVSPRTPSPVLPSGPTPLAAGAVSVNPLTLSAALALAARAAQTRQAQFRVTAARRAAHDAPALLSPTVDASVGVTPSESQTSRLDSGALLNFPLGLPGARQAVRAIRAAARASAAQSAAALAVSGQAVAQGVVQTFFTVAADQAQQKAARRSVLLATRSFAAAQARHSVGAAPRLDVVRARSAVETAQGALDAATAALRGDRRALERWVGTQTIGVVTVPPLPTSLPSQIMLADIARVPQAQVSAAQAAGAAAAAETANAALRPQAELGAGIETRGPTVGPALVLTLNLPLDTRLLQAQAQAARAAQAVAQASQAQAVRQAAAAYLTARAQAQSALARVPDLQAADRDAEQVAQADLAAYRLGAVPSSELILAQQEAAASRSALAAARVQAAQAVALLSTFVMIPEGDHP